MCVEISWGVGFGNESVNRTDSAGDWKFSSTCEHVKEIQYASCYWILYWKSLTYSSLFAFLQKPAVQWVDW